MGWYACQGHARGGSGSLIWCPWSSHRKNGIFGGTIALGPRNLQYCPRCHVDNSGVCVCDHRSVFDLDSECRTIDALALCGFLAVSIPFIAEVLILMKYQ